jgi:hypothetical protein
MARQSPASALSMTFSSSDSSDGGSSADHESWSRTQRHSKPPIAATSSTGMFDRYLHRSVTVPSFTEQTVHYIVHRRRFRKNGVKRKLFQITNARTSDVLAGAKFASMMSNVLKVSNHRGLVCEVDIKGSSGPFVMRLGIEPMLVLTRGWNWVVAEFMELDGTVPPYSELKCEATPEVLMEAFVGRQAIKSVKNCRLCRGNEEIVAVRKVQKNRLEIDAKRNLSFLSCFVVGLFMFLSKP